MTRRALVFAVLLVVTVLSPGVARTQGRGPSTPEERKRVVVLVGKLEQNPLDPALTSERAWAIKWLIDVPDISVAICPDVMGTVAKTRYKYNSDLFGLHTLAAAVFIIQHPEQAKDDIAVNVAATRSMLAGYESIAKDPRRKSKELDDLKAVRDSGGLQRFVAEALTRCTPGPKS